MDYSGHRVVYDALSWRTAAPWLGSPVELTTIFLIVLVAAFVVSQAVV